ncbi:MAG: UvrD-helicase domain-containing protein [Vicinamibacterales bacterium]|jgi:DNA helicase-2/ATP-dependent DNA helicase PcrA|nr:UvrD-helicase domain-containing protein [Vicinamibacterales bacterium]
MDFLSELNPEQREATLQTNGPLLILAGAGSGKTRVIAYRIAYLIGDGHAEADHVLAVTFTNKAAAEMRARVERLLESECGRLWISTFHSLCARLLRREAPALGLSRDFVIYDSTDQLAVVKRAIRDLGFDDKLLPPKAALGRISSAKNRMQSPDDLAASGWGPFDDRVVQIYTRYARALGEAGALDFDDLLLKTVELFDVSERVRTKYAEQFRYVLVDEYQDTNRPQYMLIRRLAEKHRNLCVVGDPDQSIYKWRGADLRNIMDFEEDFPETKVVRLERNYRSTQVILDAASAVIRQNLNRKEKRLWTEQAAGARITYYRGGDELEEADFIATAARGATLDSADAGPGEAALAVLYRTNAQSRAIEDALLRVGVAYRIIGGVRFYERKEIKDTLAYLKLAINPDDDVSLRRVINVPTRGIGKGVMESLERIDPATHNAPLLAASADEDPPASLWRRVVRAVDERLVPTRALSSLSAFRTLVEHLGAVAHREPASATVEAVLDQSGYLHDLQEERSEEAQARIENLQELVSAAREYEAQDAEPSLNGFVDRLSLLSETDEVEGDDAAHVALMTLHASKGLEFPTVVMAGLEEGLFPHARAREDDEELEEERRLCYVGMTRAQQRLVLTGCARRRVFGEYQASDASRFVDEVPAALVDRLGATGSAGSAGQGSLLGSGRRSGRGWGGGRAHRPKPAEETFEPTYAYEDEDQSLGTVGPGTRVRHPLFGIGTIVAVEPLHDDAKLTVKFRTAGQKKLLAKYAKLTPA